MAQKSRDFNDLVTGGSRKAELLHKEMIKQGIDFASGVPCGVLRHIIRNLQEDTSVHHQPANRESEAVGIAAGAYLAGKKPVVYMQNSGLFAASNDIASLVVPYRIPLLLLVSYRGCAGEDAVQHLVTGRGTESLLTTLKIAYKICESDYIPRQVQSLCKIMRKTSQPVCLLFKRGWQT